MYQNFTVWLEITRDMMTDIVISPLHGRDIQADGQRNQYYHVVFTSFPTKSFEQVKILARTL